jgi:hypothetical protein
MSPTLINAIRFIPRHIIAKHKKNIFKKEKKIFLKKGMASQLQWLTAIIPATWEVEHKKIKVWGQLGKNVSKIPF